jgi:uncharacterized membrane protein
MRNIKRLGFIDSARGTAMLFVFIAHFTEVHYSKFELGTASLLGIITKIASPTFMAISGIMLGYLYQSSGDNFKKIKAKFIDRGIFLLTVGHILCGITVIPKSDSILDALLKWMFITDTIGFCIILGPLLISRINIGWRLILGLSIFGFSWLAIAFVHPHYRAWMILEEVFLGSIHQEVMRYTFSFLPWFGFYLVNSCVGEKIAIYHRNNLPVKISKTFLVLGITSFVLAISLKIGFQAFKTYYLLPSDNIFHLLFSPWQKVPPSPLYFLAYGSMSYFIFFLLFELRNMGAVNQYIRATSILGRNSLFVFIFQFYVYYLLLRFMNLSCSIFWPLYLTASIIPIFAVALLWEKKRMNRFIGVGTVGFWEMEFSSGNSHSDNTGKRKLV